MNALHPLVTDILKKRSIPEAEWEAFLHPNFERDLPDPFIMKDMQKAVERLAKAIETKEKVLVFGDYDADGVPATAVLVRGLALLNLVVESRIPTRAAGYGLNPKLVEEIIASKITLLITVDNGSVARQEIETLQKAGIEVIVCDHHQALPEHLAAPFALLNPKQPGCPYPFKELCGCAIGWKLLWALCIYLKKDPNQLKWLLDLVALSTIADMVPLLGENRALVHFGLKVMSKSRNKGLRALAEVAGVDLNMANSTMVGFQLAPRLNAPSRMHSDLLHGQTAALQLLLTENEREALELAQYLQEHNQTRQRLVVSHLEEAESKMKDYSEHKILVLENEAWSTGLIGLVAGRLVEAYQRPVVVLAKEEREWKGSVRSVDGVNAVELLQAGESFLVRFGGHEKAAGFTLKGEEIEAFRKVVNEWIESKEISLEMLQQAQKLNADAELILEEVTLNLVEQLEDLAPFGVGFAEPLVSTRCNVVRSRRVGKEEAHLSCYLEQGLEQRKAIWFRAPTIEQGEYKVYFKLQKEEWQGRVGVSCQISRVEK